MIKTILTLIGAAILAFGLVTQSPPAPAAANPGKTASGAAAGGG